MTLEEQKAVLGVAVARAIENGWTIGDWTDADDFEWRIESDEYEINPLLWYTGLGDEFWLGFNNIVYDHEFAKAIWGDRWDRKKGCEVHKGIHSMSAYGDDLEDPWSFHLMEMVVSDDPIDYLRKNI